jgi:hypothetical protein
METVGRERDIEVHCQRCNKYWDVIGFVEYGVWYPHDEKDLTCDDCGEEVEES